MKNNPDKPWDWGWKEISSNPSITMDFVENNPDKPWEWNYISSITFEIDYENVLKKLMFENYHEELIQKTWHPSRFLEWCLYLGEE